MQEANCALIVKEKNLYERFIMHLFHQQNKGFYYKSNIYNFDEISDISLQKPEVIIIDDAQNMNNKDVIMLMELYK